jgi:signal transduction histidine kinase
MTKPFGLRSEIVISSSLLVGAALLFIALLLLRLSETRLLEQSVTLHSHNAQSLTGLLNNRSQAELPRLIKAYAQTNELSGWHLSDSQNKVLGAEGQLADAGTTVSIRKNQQNLLWQPLVLDVHYPPTWKWLLGVDEEPRYADLSVAVISSQRLTLLLRFSLEEIYQQIVRLQKFALVCCLAYGLVLVVTAVFLLNRSVVQPIVNLTSRTQLISQGDLSQRVDPTGPREITLLGRAFNLMAENLQTSAQHQQQQLNNLQHSNQQLQLAQRHLAQSERMASVGNLTSGIAHEIGNPLSAVIGYLELLKKKPLTSDQHDLVVRSLSESGRMDQLLKDMLDFASAGLESGSARCTPLEVIEQTCAMLHQQGGLKQRRVLQQLPEQLPTAKIAAHQLQQVLVNLILNARDATLTGGTITIAAAGLEPADTGAIEISVSDDGQGISAEQQQAIFDPFFTTKAQGKGRGLGLYVCYQLIQACGGKLTVSSQPLHGSSFTITLPCEGTSRHDCC